MFFRTLLLALGVSATGLAQMAISTESTKTAPGAPKLTYSSVHVDGPFVALTFDDGPNPATTPRLLDMLAKRNIKATFFVLGERLPSHPELLKREMAEGHEIGNHSWDHPNLAKKSDEFVRSELQRTHDAIAKITGVAPKLMRPPYGSLTLRQERWIVDSMGYKVILWAVDPKDWKRPGPAVVAQRILTETHPGDIVLMHDIHAQSVDAVPQILDGLTAKGFKFVTVSQLLAMGHPAKPKATPVQNASNNSAAPTATITVATPTPASVAPAPAAAVPVAPASAGPK